MAKNDESHEERPIKEVVRLPKTNLEGLFHLREGDNRWKSI